MESEDESTFQLQYESRGARVLIILSGQPSSCDAPSCWSKTRGGLEVARGRRHAILPSCRSTGVATTSAAAAASVQAQRSSRLTSLPWVRSSVARLRAPLRRTGPPAGSAATPLLPSSINANSSRVKPLCSRSAGPSLRVPQPVILARCQCLGSREGGRQRLRGQTQSLNAEGSSYTAGADEEGVM